MAVRARIVKLRALGAEAARDLFDQETPFGRLALVQVLMLAGDTLVTISLAGSLFFSISPDAAKSKVLLYLLLTIAPFAVVSPFLGPLIDRSRNSRRAMVVISAVGRAVLCLFMARDIHSLALFPEAFLILVLSKLYLVTRGALVPEIAAADAQMAEERGWSAGHDAADAYLTEKPIDGSTEHGLAGWNAQLTLLGTLAGFVASVPGVILLKAFGSPAVLIFCSALFLGGGVAAWRLHLPKAPADDIDLLDIDIDIDDPWDGGWDEDPDVVALRRSAHPEVVLGLTANSLLRGIAGFLVFLLAFGLRRSAAPLWWYGLALGASGVGALIGLSLVPRLRRFMAEPSMLLSCLVAVCLGAVAAAYLGGGLEVQMGLALLVGIAGAVGQPSFDALTQQYVPVAAQGRAFAKFATRQQLLWVIGAVIPVALAMPLLDGDVLIAVIAGLGALLYTVGRFNRIWSPRARRRR
jgi:hypothetical protein